MKRSIASVLRILHKPVVYLESVFDPIFRARDVPSPQRIAHPQWHEYIYSLGNKPGMRILEVGGREVCGVKNARQKFADAEYVSFDYYAGANVDVVGDAHKLSSYFRPDEKFDVIYSSACFEHFAMPWRVVTEMAKLLRVGGVVFVETHFAFSSHERPWHFFHFTDLALKALFSPALGFECIEAGMSCPIVGRFSAEAAPYLRYRQIRGMYCFSEYLGKKVRDVPEFGWEDALLDDIVGATAYPAPRKATA